MQIPREERPDLAEVLEELLAEQKVQISKRGRLSRAEKKYATGTFISHAKGFGFVSVEEEAEDIFIGEQDTGGAFLGDTVRVE